jgi:hypothetical protein
VLTERHARTLYELPDEPLPPVFDCALDGVAHLWLVVPPRGRSADARELRSILSDAQMCAAVEFAEKAAGAEMQGGEGGGGAGPILLACSERNEVDVAALAVLLLARRARSSERAPFPDRRYRQRGQRAQAGCELTYQAARLLDNDPGVSLVWKGLLGWQDVECLQAVLWNCDRDGV